MKVTNSTTLNVQVVLNAFAGIGLPLDTIAEITMRDIEFRGTKMVEVDTVRTSGASYKDHFSYEGEWLD